MELASSMTGSGDSKTIPPRFWLSSIFAISQLGDSLLNSSLCLEACSIPCAGEGGSMYPSFLDLATTPGLGKGMEHFFFFFEIFSQCSVENIHVHTWSGEG